MTRNKLYIADDTGMGTSSLPQLASWLVHPLGMNITRETCLWALIALAVVALRVWALGATPLTNTESRIALDSLSLARGTALTSPDPFFSGIQSMLMSIFGATNFTARLVTALAGVWICLLPLLARAQLGRGRALVFSLLLTLSPTLWFASRQAEGNMLAWALAGTAVLTFMRNRGRAATAICAGLLLACGQDAISPLLVIAVSGLIVVLNNKSRAARATLTPSFADVFSAIIAFVLASTIFLWRPSGLGDAFNGIATWFSTLVTPGNLGLLRVVSGLIAYEPLLMLSAIISITLLVFQQKFTQIDAIWVVWVAAGLLLLLVDQSREVADMLPLMIGCAGLATHLWVEALLVPLPSPLLPLSPSRVIGAVVCAVTIVMLIYAYLGLSLYAEQQQPASLLSILLAGIMIVGAGIVCTLLVDSGTRIALRSIALAYGICMVIYTFGAGFQLTQVRSTNPAESYVAEATDAGIDHLVQTIETTSLRANGDPNVMPLQVLDAAPPALRWALRNQLGVTYVSRLTDGAAALTPTNVKPESTGVYVGSAFRITSGATLAELRCQPAAPAPGSNQLNCLPLVRWYTKRTVDEKLVTKWILWLSSDTANRASGVQ